MAAKVLKYFLAILSDSTFLSSIEYFDFENRYVSVKREFFNLCFNVASSNDKITKPKRLGAILKQLFVQRFTSVTASNLKKFFDHKISNAYIDFINVARYYSSLLQSDNVDFQKFFKNYLNKRNFRFYEKKGYKYYKFIKLPKIQPSNQQSDPSLLTTDDDQSTDHDSDVHSIMDHSLHSETSSNHESSTSQPDSPILSATDEPELFGFAGNFQIKQNFNDIIESDEESSTSSEMRAFLNDEIEDNNLLMQYGISPSITQQYNNISNEEYHDMIEQGIQPSSFPPPPPENYDLLQDQINHSLASNIVLNSTPNFTGNSSDWDKFYDRLESRIESNNQIIESSTKKLLNTNIDCDL